jgi:hypothetical protein
MAQRTIRIWFAWGAAAFAGGLLLFGAAACGGRSAARPTPTVTAIAPQSALLDLARFHYVAALTLRSGSGDSAKQVVISTEGDFQAPDRHAFTYRTELPGVTLTQSAVVIGDRVWLRSGDAAWQQTTPTGTQAQQLLATAFSPIRPDFLGGPDFRNARASVQRLPATLEFVNDVRSYHYQVGAEGEQYFRSFLASDQLVQAVQDLHWDIWLAEEGAWPVRLLASGTVTSDLQILKDLDLAPPTSWELRIDISRPNDPTLVVQAPG